MGCGLHLRGVAWRGGSRRLQQIAHGIAVEVAFREGRAALTLHATDSLRVSPCVCINGERYV